jgi:peptide/nickel transport system permease protein
MSVATEALGNRIPVAAATTRRVRPAVIGAAAFIILLAVAAAAPSVLTSGSPYGIHLDQALRAPSMAHPFGTDESGRDVLTRVIYGTRSSLAIGVGATALAMVFAIVLGLAAGLTGGAVDAAISRALEVIFGFPGLVLALLFVAMYGPGVTTEIVAVAIGSAPGYARMIRGQVLAVKGSGYVEVARALGHSRTRIVRAHIFPNAMRPLVVLATMGVGQSIVWASSLSFLGLGVAPPDPEWGAMLEAGRDYIAQSWWLEFFPGAVIVGCTLAATTLGRYMQQRLESELTQ